MAAGAVSEVEWPVWEDLAFYAQPPEVVHASMRALRQAEPVHWYEPGGYWVLSKWEHQRFVLSNPELFCSEFGHLLADASDPETVMHQLPDFAQERLRQPGLSAAQKRGIIMQATLSFGMPDFQHFAMLDPPQHGEVRKVFMRALRPSLVRSLRPLIAEIADEVLDEIPAGQEVDFVPFAARIQPSIMAELIGVERDMRVQFAQWATAHVRAVGINPDLAPEEIAEIQAHKNNLRTYVEGLIEDRRRTGATGEDLVSQVIRAEVNGEPVPPEHYFPFVTSFVSGGETTRIFLANVARGLAEHPDQLELLHRQPELIPNVVEETLRYYPINWSQGRTATRDIELGGQTIRKHDFVIMPLPSANRDEDIWERPDEYDITRSFANDHVALGHGEHSCPGALLTRTDTSVVLGRMLEHFKGWELTGTPTIAPATFVQGIDHLPLTFHT